MTYAPKTLTEARAYIVRAFGVPANAVGIVGDSAHRGGYHCGSDRTTSGDYSVNESSRDRRGLSGAASALDIGSFSKGKRNLRSFSKWLAAECARDAPDTRDIREVIYSPDGRTVRRWDRLRRRSTGDDSHLWHTHISYFRDSEKRDKTAVFRRYIEGDDDMPSAKEIAEAVWNTDGVIESPSTWLDSDPKNKHIMGSTFLRSIRDQVVKMRAESTANHGALLAAIGELSKANGASPEQVKAAALAGAREALAEADLEVSWAPGQEE